MSKKGKLGYDKSELMKQIIETVKESPTISRKMLKEFGVIK